MFHYTIVIYANRMPTADPPGRYNVPSISEVEVVCLLENNWTKDISYYELAYEKLSEVHYLYDSLKNRLMFCRGEDEYSINIAQVNRITRDLVQKNSCVIITIV